MNSQLRAKFDLMFGAVDLRRVFGENYTRAEWKRHMSNIALATPLGLVRPGQKPDPDEHAAIGTKVSRLMGGARRMAPEQLARLAEHTGLDRYLGGREQAAQWLSDKISYEDFQRRLYETGWANPDVGEHALYGTRHLLLTAFDGFNLGREGIRVGPDIIVTANKSGPTRGSRMPQPEDRDAELPNYPIGSKLKVRIELDRPAEIVIFEVGPAPEKQHGYKITCLAPSPLAPERKFAAGAIVLPSRSYGGLGDHYVLDHPLGRHDWLAVLTGERLELPWPEAKHALHEVSPTQLQSLMGLMRGRLDGPAKGPIEIRHFAFMATG